MGWEEVAVLVVVFEISPSQITLTCVRLTKQNKKQPKQLFVFAPEVLASLRFLLYSCFTEN